MKKWTEKDLEGRPGIKKVTFQFDKKELVPDEPGDESATGVTEIVINVRVPGLNSSDGLMREHWTKGMKRKEALTWIIRSQTKKRYIGPVKVTFSKYAHKYMDWDNFCASFKHIGDALKDLLIIEDDKPSVIRKFTPQQFLVKKSKECKIVISIQKVATYC